MRDLQPKAGQTSGSGPSAEQTSGYLPLLHVARSLQAQTAALADKLAATTVQLAPLLEDQGLGPGMDLARLRLVPSRVRRSKHKFSPCAIGPWGALFTAC